MTTEPTEPQSASRHPYSTRGLSLRLLLLGAMLMSLAVALTGGEPVGASSTGGRGPAGDAVLADGEPMGGQGTSSGPGTSGPGGPAGGDPAGGTSSGQASDGPQGGIVPAASASPGSPSGGSAGGPPDDWHLYHHWADPSWPDPGQATGERLDVGGEQPGGGAPLPARTPGGYNWDPLATPTAGTPPATGWTPTPGDPTDPAPGTPTSPPTTTAPAPDPAPPNDQPDAPTQPGLPGAGGPPGAPGQDQQDGDGGLRTGTPPHPTTQDPLQRDPLAAGQDDDLGLGETVDEPTPEPTPSARTVPLRAAPEDVTPASEYHQTLIYSGLVGLALAAIGLTMVGLRRRRW